MRPAERRRTALIALIERAGQVRDLIDRLHAFPWDSDVELATLRADHLLTTLADLAAGRVSELEVEKWSEALSQRDDLAFDPARADDLKQALLELSTPELFGSVAEQARHWSSLLDAAE